MKLMWRSIGLLLIFSVWITSCSTDGTQSTAAPTADQSATTRSAKISANGKVVPAQKTMLSFALPGQLIDLRVEVGSTVKKGDVIARLDTSILDAEVAKAQAAVAVAQASLDRIKAGPRAEQVVAAQSALSATTAIVQQTAANRDQIKEGPTAAEINSALAETQQAYIAMVAARTKKDLAQKNLDNHTASQDTADEAYKQYVVAEQQYAAAQARRDKLLAGADADTLRAAQANLGAASADYQAQRAQLNLLLAGARPEDIAVAAANLEQAQVAVQSAQAVRQEAELLAPFDGTISDVPVRQAQYVNAGTPVVLIADLSSLRIETTDLNEKDIVGIAIGSKAEVTFDALPDITVEGTVTQIAPKSNKASGVNYTLTLDLAQLPDRVRWGMTALIDMKR